MMRNCIVSILLIFLLLPGLGSASVSTMPYGTPAHEELDTIPNRLEDTVAVPFRALPEKEIVGAVSVLHASDILKYDNVTWANDVLLGRVLGMMGNNNIRGLGIGVDVANVTGTGLESGNVLYVVDGLPRDIRGLRLSEVETITIQKDANAAALYGSPAVNGIVYVTTKRGKIQKNEMNFRFNYGMQKPYGMPQYLNSADYMTLFNEARRNDSLSETFATNLIENYRSGNPYRYPSIDFYAKENFKSYRPYFDIVSEFTGGNDVAKYYMNYGWNSVGTILNFGQYGKARNNTFNLRGNFDLKVNNWIKARVDAAGVFNSNKAGHANYWNFATTTRPNEYTPYLPFNLIDTANAVFKARKNEIDGKYLIGGNANNLTTPFGNSYLAGTWEDVNRKFSFNNRIDFNLASLVKGLTFHTNISFDYYLRFTQAVFNNYSVYEPTWDNNDRIIDLKQHGTDAKSGSQNVGGTAFRRRIGFYGMLKYRNSFGAADAHSIESSLIGFTENFKENGVFQSLKNTHLGVQLGYDYLKKYFVDFNGAVVNSVKLAPGHRIGFTPSLGLAWLASSEDFLSSAENLDYLKFRVSGGILNTDIPFGYNLWDNLYSGSGSYNWYEGLRSRGGIVSNNWDNFNLGFVQRKNINIGFESLFFDKFLGLEANVFYDKYDGFVTKNSSIYPGFYSSFIPNENFQADAYKGVEVGVNINKSFGNFGLFAGVNTLYTTSKRLKVNEVWDNSYQYRQGKVRDANFALEAIGLFRDQAEIDNSPAQAFGTVHPGDIKYKDQNGDGVIDSNDEIFVSRWQSPFSMGLQLKLTYKNFTLFALADGRTGTKAFKNSGYMWVDANDKYSVVVLDRWTPETAATATYPRLSSVASNNNFRNSTFWMYDNSYFHIRNIQFTYNLPASAIGRVGMRDALLFVDASNVYRFAKNSDYMDIAYGSEPNYRTYSIGVQITF